VASAAPPGSRQERLAVEQPQRVPVVRGEDHGKSFAFSLIEVAELLFGYILQLVDRLRSGERREIGATRQALEEFEAQRVEAARKSVWVTGCNSWHLDDRGVPATWPWPFDRFRQEMAASRLQAFE
jgi:hypothetical protein